MLLSPCSLPLSTDIRLTDATPIDYSSTLYTRRSRWLAGWRAGSFVPVKSTIFVRAYSRAEGLYTTVTRYSSPWPQPWAWPAPARSALVLCVYCICGPLAAGDDAAGLVELARLA